MKQTYLFCLLFVSLFSNAQIINFPDANFKAKLLSANASNQIASTEIPIIFNGYPIFTYYTSIDLNNDGINECCLHC